MYIRSYNMGMRDLLNIPMYVLPWYKDSAYN